jgi:hypothetical protein
MSVYPQLRDLWKKYDAAKGDFKSGGADQAACDRMLSRVRKLSKAASGLAPTSPKEIASKAELDDKINRLREKLLIRHLKSSEPRISPDASNEI